MKTDYADIVQKAGAPLWWDENGAPRYVEFHPERCGVYVQAVALLRVACQSCGREFVVASAPKQSSVKVAFPQRKAQDPWEAIGSFHYGDPPRGEPEHEGCAAGPSMNTVPLAVVQFWVRKSESFRWKREKAYEFRLPRLRA